MPVGPFDDFDECVETMQGRVDDPQAYCGWLEQQTAEDGDLSFAIKLGDVRVGSFVEWSWQSGTAQGQIKSIHTEGRVDVPGVDLTLEATEDNPAALIESWERVGDRFRPTGTIVGRRFASLRAIEPLPEVSESAKFEVLPGGGVLPDAYRPADSDDVPEGQNCANCFFYVAPETDDGVAWCTLWAAEVEADFYCGKWAAVERDVDGVDMDEAGYKEKDKRAVNVSDMVVVETFEADREMLVTTDGRIRAATLVAIPAFVEAKIEMLSDDEDEDRYRGVLAPEGVPTGDGRMFEQGSIRFAEVPLPLLWAKSMEGGHDGAMVVGTIDSISRDGDLIVGEGRFDLGSEQGREAARQVRAGVQSGVSVDLDDVSLEVRVAAEVLEDLTVEVVASAAGVGGVGQPWQTMSLTAEERTPTAGMASEAERALAWRAEGIPGGEDNTVQRARSIANREPLSEDTVRRMNRFFLRNARYPNLEGFKPGDDGYPSRARVAWALWGGDAGRSWSAKLVERLDRQDAALVASSKGSRPSAEWFGDPKLSGPTPLTVTEDGRVFGHLALWGTCHTGFGRECVQPPSSQSGYAFFRTGVVLCNDGTEMPVGRITLDTTHAGRRHGPADTIAHYEHTGLGVAHVSAGEDAHGIWVSGAVAPGVSEDQIARLRVSPLSGDWRSVGGQLELVAALAVNSPGFPVPRALVASGRVHSLQASGVVRDSDVLTAAASDGILDDEMADALRRLAQREVANVRDERVGQAALKVAVAKAAARVRKVR